MLVLLTVTTITAQNTNEYFHDFFKRNVEMITHPSFLRLDTSTYNITQELSESINKLEQLIEKKGTTLSDVHIEKLRKTLTEFTRTTQLPSKDHWDKYFSAIQEKTPNSCETCSPDYRAIQEEFSLLNRMITELQPNAAVNTDSAPMERKKRTPEGEDLVDESLFLEDYEKLLKEKSLGVSSLYYDQPVLDLLRKIAKLRNLPRVYYHITGTEPGQIEHFMLARKLFFLIRANLEQGVEMSKNYVSMVNHYAKTYYAFTPRAADICRKRKLSPDPDEARSNKRLQPDQPDQEDCPQPSGIAAVDNTPLIIPPEISADSTTISEQPDKTVTEPELGSTEAYGTTHSTQKREADTSSVLLNLAEELKARIRQIDGRGIIGVINDLVETIERLIDIFEAGDLPEVNKLCKTNFPYLTIYNSKVIVYTKKLKANLLVEITFCGNIGCFKLDRKTEVIKILHGGYCTQTDEVSNDLYRCIGTYSATGTKCQQSKKPSSSCHFQYMLEPKEQFELLNNNTAILDKKNNLIMQNLLDREVQIMDQYTLQSKSHAFALGFHPNFTFFLSKTEIDENFADIVSYRDKIQAWWLYQVNYRDYVLYTSLGLGLFSILGFILKIGIAMFPMCRTNQSSHIHQVETHNEAEALPLRPNSNTTPSFRVVRWND